MWSSRSSRPWQSSKIPIASKRSSRGVGRFDVSLRNAAARRRTWRRLRSSSESHGAEMRCDLLVLTSTKMSVERLPITKSISPCRVL